jgi:4a-hydroxytetrahydrobiopterin dehydratase
MAALREKEIQATLNRHSGWSFSDNAIHKKFSFEAFMPAVGFVNRIARAAEEAQHHPDITINYNVVSISLSTHSEGGVTHKDIELAGQIDDLAKASG